MPTEEQLKARLAATGFTQEQLNTNASQAITSEALTPVTPLTILPVPKPTNYGVQADSYFQSLLESFNQQNKLEQEGSDIQSQLLKSMESLGGETTRKTELEQQAGLPEQRKELQGVINQLQALSKERATIPLQVQQEFEGRGATRAGVAPIEIGRTRENTIKALGLAAIGQTFQGNIGLAESTIQSALDAEFEPERQKLQTLAAIYQFNKDALERQDKKRSDMLTVTLNERSRLLAIQETDKKELYDIGKLAGQNGAASQQVQDIFNSKTKEEAAAKAAPFLQDPLQKQQLSNALLTNELTRLNINKTAYELDLLKKYGGMTPAQYAAYLKDEKKTIEEAEEASEKTRLQGQALGEKMTLINSVLNSNAIDSVVGPSIVSRAATGFGGFAGRFAAGAVPGAVTGGLTFGPPGILVGGIITGSALAFQGSKDYFTGAGDKLVGQTEQFISKEFLQSLIDVKAQGATFGALQKAEQDALTAAATFIGQRRICSGGGRGVCGEKEAVVGYDLSEADFRKEFGKIQKYAQLAYERSTGNSWAPDEQITWDALESAQSTLQFNAGDW